MFHVLSGFLEEFGCPETVWTFVCLTVLTLATWMSGPRPDLLCLGCLDLVRIFCTLDVWTSSGSFVPWLSGPCPDLLCLGCLDLVRIFVPWMSGPVRILVSWWSGPLGLSVLFWEK